MERPPALTLVVVAGGLATMVAPGGCDVETRYHCARVVADPDRDSGRTLVLDGVRHSYVDINDPTFLKFRYVRAIASVVDAVFPEGEPLAAHHLGGGGLTLPRYLAATRPGTRSLVSEIDSGVVRIDHDRLGLRPEQGIDVRAEDGRLGLRRLGTGSRDLVVGDAFGSVSVPWHLTTVEAMTDVRRVLDEDGLYVANLIDHGDLAFARAEAATLSETFEHVALLGEPGDIGLDPGATPRGRFPPPCGARHRPPRIQPAGSERDDLDPAAMSVAGPPLGEGPPALCEQPFGQHTVVGAVQVGQVGQGLDGTEGAVGRWCRCRSTSGRLGRCRSVRPWAVTAASPSRPARCTRPFVRFM